MQKSGHAINERIIASLAEVVYQLAKQISNLVINMPSGTQYMIADYHEQLYFVVEILVSC